MRSERIRGGRRGCSAAEIGRHPGGAPDVARPMAKGTLRIGIGGWTYPPWRGEFYPPGLPQPPRARICSQQVRRDRDQRHLLRPAKPEKLGRLGKPGPRRLPVRDQGLALLRDAPEARRRRRRHRQFSRPGYGGARAQARPDPVDVRGAPPVRPRRHRRLPRPAAARARRHPAPPRHRAAARELPRRAFLRPVPGARRRHRLRRRRRIPVHRCRHRELRLRAAAAHARGGADRL